jgi:hypothetical protein
MKLDKFNRIAIHIILTFIIAILSSFIPDNFHDFFGDWLCEGNYNWEEPSGCNYLGVRIHDPKWHWGARHWLWMSMGACLFVLQFFKIINIIDEK